MTKYTRKNAPYGKGDSRRQGADDEKYRKNYDRIFGKKEQRLTPPCDPICSLACDLGGCTKRRIISDS